MIPFKYYIKIYKRYIKLSIQNKKQNIKEWFSNPREERYKYFNPDKEKERLYDSGSNIAEAMFGTDTAIRGGSIGMRDKIYCKDINRQIHYSKGRIKTIINVLNSIFTEPFDTFLLKKNTNKSNEELAVDIDKSTKKMLLYFFLLLAILFITILLFSMNGPHLSQEIIIETSNAIGSSPKVDHNYSIVFVIVILAIIEIYVTITLLVSVMFSIVMFIYLWKFVNKNACITSKF